MYPPGKAKKRLVSFSLFAHSCYSSIPSLMSLLSHLRSYLFLLLSLGQCRFQGFKISLQLSQFPLQLSPLGMEGGCVAFFFLQALTQILDSVILVNTGQIAAVFKTLQKVFLSDFLKGNGSDVYMKHLLWTSAYYSNIPHCTHHCITAI